jgi:gliding motility-associated-like protein
VNEPDPGGDGFIALCSTDAIEDLFDNLEGNPDQGGTWTTPTGGAFNGTFDPASNTPGVYTYTIAVPQPCTSVSATVTVEVVAAPDAGSDGALTLCISSPASELFPSIAGNPQAGGTWTTPSGAAFGGSFTPGTHAPGDYTYMVAGTAPCPAASAVVSVAVTDEPSAGNNSILNLCETGDPVELFPVLGGADAGGSWQGPGAGNFQGTFTPGSDPAGAYSYTVTGTPPCPSVTATITVNVLLDANAGTDGGLTLCGNGPQTDLFGQLGGSPDAGGIWLGPTGMAFNGSFDPATDAMGSYTYVVVVPLPCLNDTSIVEVAVITPPDAGVDAELDVCASEAAFALVDILGGNPDAGGTWAGPAGASDGTFDPGGSAAGVYTYTVAGTAPCANDQASITVSVEPIPNAGTNGSLTLCPEASPVQLFDLLGGTPDAGGTWTGPGGIPSNGVFDPASDAQGNYTYTVSGNFICPDSLATATLAIYLIDVPDAGPDAVSCTLEATLDATGNWSSGSWSGPAGISFANASDPATEVSASNGGSYLLTWSTVSDDGCASGDSVMITFTDAIVPAVTASDAICHGDCNGTATVVTTGGNLDGNGYGYQWSAGVPPGQGATATGLCAGSYTVTVLDMNACNGTASFTINEPEPHALQAIAATPEICPGNCDGTIVILSEGSASYSITGGDSFQTGSFFGGLCPGNYVIVTQDGSGCLAQGLATVGSAAPVVAGFTWSPDPVHVSDPTVTFNNTSTINAVDFSWDFGGIGSSTAESPEFTFPGVLGENYVVCLTAWDANGCSDTYCVGLEVLDVLQVWIPNAFTPQGDGINDTFKPVFNLPDVADYEFLIFNRWGEQIFTSLSPDMGWDGRVGGVTSQTEVYVWKLIYRDPQNVERKELRGHVTLLK